MLVELPLPKNLVAVIKIFAKEPNNEYEVSFLSS